MFDIHNNIQDEAVYRLLSQNAQIREMEREHEAMQACRYAPKYHFYSCTPNRRLTDPNGLCKKNGLFHMFYQQCPGVGKKTHWGHAVSRDLIRWTELPSAIAPGKEIQVYSGTALVEEDRALAIYHGVGLGNMIAQSNDEYLVNWTKLSDDAVIPVIEIDENGKPYRVFDPCLWREEDGYYYSLSGTYVGPKAKMVRGKHFMMPYLFRSKDLLNWLYIGEFMPNNPFYSSGEDCACPYFMPLGDQFMLLHFSGTTD